MKKRGVLLPIFSLPSKYGIGDFGNEAYEFIDILSENCIDYWQILPINASLNKPYSPLSYYALNIAYISLDKLKEEGLLDEIKTRPSTDRVIYDGFKMPYFQEALKKFVPDDDYKEFIKNEEIRDYVNFIQRKFGGTKEFHFFLQYKAYKQWMAIKEYANKKKVYIIGDMPAYPVFDSAETTYHSKYYEMENGQFKYEAGAPPDFYNKDGQKWGNPVYDIDKLKKDKYQYLIKRYKYFINLFDIVRLDYFKGFDAFYKVPIGQTPDKGMYCDGLSYGFFDTLFNEPGIQVEDFIIEDLGDIREETVALRKHYGFTRQKILQFTLDINNQYDKDNVSDNAVVSTGTHDCKTIKSWYEELSESYKTKLKKFLKDNNCDTNNINVGIMQYSLKCKGKISIIPVQDILGYDDSTRINVPGTISDLNWTWKLTDFDYLKKRIVKFNLNNK